MVRRCVPQTAPASPDRHGPAMNLLPIAQAPAGCLPCAYQLPRLSPTGDFCPDTLNMTGQGGRLK
ncbi:MAG: hypothetical protein Alpg2KO_01280 [Alphaproteobacteria bacterium]